MPYLSIVIAASGVAFFWCAAEIEGAPRWLWGGLSLLISAAMLFWLQWSFVGIILGQICLFAGITFFRSARER